MILNKSLNHIWTSINQHLKETNESALHGYEIYFLRKNHRIISCNYI